MATTLDANDVAIVARALDQGFRNSGFWGYGYTSRRDDGKLVAEHHRCPHCDTNWNWVDIKEPIVHADDCPTQALKRVLAAI